MWWIVSDVVPYATFGVTIGGILWWPNAQSRSERAEHVAIMVAALVVSVLTFSVILSWLGYATPS